MGDQAGVYSTLDDHGPCSAEALASKTNLDERYLLEWLSANAAMGYITFNEDSHQFSLTPEQAAIFAHEGNLHVCKDCFKVLLLNMPLMTLL